MYTSLYYKCLTVNTKLKIYNILIEKSVGFNSSFQFQNGCVRMLFTICLYEDIC